MQWHPLFAKLLRSIVEEYYDVETNLPVGEGPRSADIVLVRRTSTSPTPFRGLLHHLTTWNILEYKGRSVSARIRDLDLLAELGLGIDRRLNEERHRQKLRPLDPSEVSFWYIVNHLGKRFLDDARKRLGGMEESGPGVWRSQILLRPIFLIDGRNVPVERESVPLHLVGEESQSIDTELANVVVDEPGFWELYAPLLKTLHPKSWKEAKDMARSKGKRNELDLSPLIEEVGLEKYLEAVEIRDAIDAFSSKKLLKEMDVEEIWANLTADKRAQLKERLK